jgi:hypothetical protein
MNQYTKRIISFLVTFLMIFTLPISLPVNAAEEVQYIYDD